MSSVFTFALAGNPNAGKTSIFNALTGARQGVGNYPGVTVEKKEGVIIHKGQRANIVDLPGTYSLTAYSLDEVVARDFIIEQRPDVVINVIDASNLERNLYLALQFMELGIPVLLCLNMIDMARARNIKIDSARLSSLLGGIPVVETVGRRGEGLDRLLEEAFALARRRLPWRPLTISYGRDLDQALDLLTPVIAEKIKTDGSPPASRWLALKYLEGDQIIINRLQADAGTAALLNPVRQKLCRHLQATIEEDPESVVADYRYIFISSLTRAAVNYGPQARMELSDKIDRVLTHRLLGPLFLLAILYLVYQVVFLSGEAPVDWCENFFAWLGGQARESMAEGLLRSLLVDGVIAGLGGVIGFVPLIIAMFFMIAILEDSGYLARIAYILDRVLRIFGLHGNAVICLISSGGMTGGCAVPGIMAARTLKDPKSRLTAILIAPFMNCGAKLPVYGLLIAAFFSHHRAEVMFALTLLSWTIALLAARILRSTLLRGEKIPFVMELPPYRCPTVRGVLIHSWERIWEYLKRAGTILLTVSIIMWALMTYPGLPAAELERLEKAQAAAASEEERQSIANRQAQAALAHSLAGRAGIFLENYTTWLELDWRVNVALLGGLAAKEVIVSTLGTAYSMSEEQWEEDGSSSPVPAAAGSEPRLSLAGRLAQDPGWSPLKALAVMILVMIYSPCVASLSVMKKETGRWRWPLFSLCFNTLIGYLLAAAIYQAGRMLF
ncbi:MAG: ferrous iron transport protein B [Desulfarculales bacterium]|jgi:ferrous iron transport protein B|nr:ferrous iron transport protein B [Desulfarculales bacterium]